MNKKIEDKLMHGYPLDLGKVIEESFNVFKKTFLIGGAALILLTIVFVILYFGIIGVAFGFGNFSETILQMQGMTKSPTYIISTALTTTISSAIMAPITAGYIHINYLAKRNKEFSFSTIFEFFKGKYTSSLMLAYAIIGFTMAIINSLMAFANLEFLAFIPQGLISLVTIFTIPLIIYENMSYSDALSKSISLFGKQPFAIFGIGIIAFLFAMLGFIAFCLGIFFTIPFLYSSYYAIYEEAVGFEDKSEIEEIGYE